ncbi:hypothetical protein BSKO_11214 [Bryopsis sp. KO-2023]|nr:hypothetical protein BSKO_11214 [Bryopsis sp. KO-2023]
MEQSVYRTTTLMREMEDETKKDIQTMEKRMLAAQRRQEMMEKQNSELVARKEDYEKRIITKEEECNRLNSELLAEKNAHMKIQAEISNQHRLEIHNLENEADRRSAALRQAMGEAQKEKVESWREELEQQVRRNLDLSVNNQRLKRVGDRYVRAAEKCLDELVKNHHVEEEGAISSLRKEIETASVELQKARGRKKTSESPSTNVVEQAWRPNSQGLKSTQDPSMETEGKKITKEAPDGSKKNEDKKINDAQMNIMIQFGEELMESKNQVRRLTEDLEKERRAGQSFQTELRRLTSEYQTKEIEFAKSVGFMKEQQEGQLASSKELSGELDASKKENDELRAKLEELEQLHETVSNLYFALVAETQESGGGHDRSDVQVELIQVKAALGMKNGQTDDPGKRDADAGLPFGLEEEGAHDKHTATLDSRGCCQFCSCSLKGPEESAASETFVDFEEERVLSPRTILYRAIQTQTENWVHSGQLETIREAPDDLEGIQKSLEKENPATQHTQDARGCANAETNSCSSQTVPLKGEVQEEGQGPHIHIKVFRDSEAQTRASSLSLGDPPVKKKAREAIRESASIDDIYEELLYFEQVAYDEQLERYNTAKQLESLQVSMAKELEEKDAQLKYERKTLAKNFSRHLQQLRRCWQKYRQTHDGVGIKKLCHLVDSMTSDLNEEMPAAALNALTGNVPQYTSTGTQTIVRLPQSAWSQWNSPREDEKETDPLMITSARSFRGDTISLAVDIPTDMGCKPSESEPGLDVPTSVDTGRSTARGSEQSAPSTSADSRLLASHRRRERNPVSPSTNTALEEEGMAWSWADLMTGGESPGPWASDPDSKQSVRINVGHGYSSTKFEAGDVQLNVETVIPESPSRPSSNHLASWGDVRDTVSLQNDRVRAASGRIRKLQMAIERRGRRV